MKLQFVVTNLLLSIFLFGCTSTKDVSIKEVITEPEVSSLPVVTISKKQIDTAMKDWQNYWAPASVGIEKQSKFIPRKSESLRRMISFFNSVGILFNEKTGGYESCNTFDLLSIEEILPETGNGETAEIWKLKRCSNIENVKISYPNGRLTIQAM